MAETFGLVMKEWRQVRRMSQMNLGLAAGVSSRHISFLETGRSQPSRGMVLRLCDEMHVPNAARNRLLLAAGMAPAFGRTGISEDEMAPLREAVDRMLQNHAPFPAMAVNRYWQLVSVNPPAQMLLDVVGLGVGDSLIDALINSPKLREAIENIEEVEALTLMRLRTELTHWGQDRILERAITALQEKVGNPNTIVQGQMPAVIPTRYRLNGAILSFFSTITQFGSTGDIAMSELKIEMLFPADEQTRLLMRDMSAQ